MTRKKMFPWKPPLFKKTLQSPLLGGIERVAPDAVSAFARGVGVAALRDAGRGVIDVVLAVLEFQQITGSRPRKILRFKAREFPGFDAGFFRSEHSGGVSRTAIHAAVAVAVAVLSFALARTLLALAIAVLIPGEQFVGPIFARALALA